MLHTKLLYFFWDDGEALGGFFSSGGGGETLGGLFGGGGLPLLTRNCFPSFPFFSVMVISLFFFGRWR